MLPIISTASKLKTTIGLASTASPKNKWAAPIIGGFLSFTAGYAILVFHGGQIIYQDIKERMRYHYETKKAT